jgi:predicted glycoside hydrolase/deacetylase ChbG (UPF0249 family)
MEAIRVKLLIVNADDFGLNRAATDAIVECHRAGSVTSTTLMANAPDCERAAGLASGLPALGVGMHFNLTWGEPLARAGEVPTLVDAEGRLHPRERLARLLLLGRVDPEHIARELAAQWQRLREAGVAPTHMDSHQHVHAFPRVFDAVAAHCAREDIPVRVPWVANGGGGIGRRARRAVLRSMLARAVGPWRGKLRWNDSINSVFDLGEKASAGGFDDADYVALLRCAGDGVHELMVHAATEADAMRGYTRIGSIAAAEYAWLRQGTLPALAAQLGYGLGNYRNLP